MASRTARTLTIEEVRTRFEQCSRLPTVSVAVIWPALRREGFLALDRNQLARFGVLVEEAYGRTPPFMRIQYADRWFDEPYSAERKRWVLEIGARLRRARR